MPPAPPPAPTLRLSTDSSVRMSSCWWSAGPATSATPAGTRWDTSNMTTSADTHCPYCALQCAMTLTSPADPAPASQPGPGTPARAASTESPSLEVAGRDFPTNRGGLCRKGWTSASLLNHAGRITEPLLKGADGVHRPIGWDQALDLAAAAVKDARARYGADAVG